jgi:hypothetical protein
MAVVLDHLLLGGPDLAALIEDLAARTGVYAARGGAHEGAGTHNALLDLGNRRYLELLAPLPRAEADGKLPLATLLGQLVAPRLLAWAAATRGLAEAVERARSGGYDPGSVIAMERTPPGGRALTWHMTLGGNDVLPGVVPFLIEWAGEEHPSSSAPTGCKLMQLRAEHPEPAGVRRSLASLGAELDLTTGSTPRLIATIDTPRGSVELA